MCILSNSKKSATPSIIFFKSKIQLYLALTLNLFAIIDWSNAKKNERKNNGVLFRNDVFQNVQTTLAQRLTSVLKNLTIETKWNQIDLKPEKKTKIWKPLYHKNPYKVLEISAHSAKYLNIIQQAYNFMCNS